MSAKGHWQSGLLFCSDTTERTCQMFVYFVCHFIIIFLNITDRLTNP